MRVFLRTIPALLCALGLALAGPLSAFASSQSPAPTTLSVAAGGSSQDQAVQLYQFYPGTATIDVGDTITWTVASGEVHTVSFGTAPFSPTDKNYIDEIGAPAGGSTFDGTGYTNSGILLPSVAPGPPQIKSYSLTFTKAGTYQYKCTLHQPAMNGTVVVQAAGTAYPPSQATYKMSSDPAFTAGLQAGQAKLAAERATSKANGNGKTTYTLDAGSGSTQPAFGLFRFGASSLTIHSGDTVTWVQNDPSVIHTVSFLNAGQDVPFTLPNGQVNPAAAAPTGGKTYNGSGYFNSGILPPAALAPAPARTYSLTFTKVGTYKYVCLIHDDLGMAASIQVLAATLPTRLPNTGGPPIGGLVAIAGLLSLAGGLTLRRRAR